MLKGFQQFILRGNVVDLAVGVIIGSSFATIVSSFVKDILNPLIALFGGQPDFSKLVLSIGPSQFLIGNFLNALVAFLINAAVIYFLVVTPMNRLWQGSKSTPVKKKTK